MPRRVMLRRVSATEAVPAARRSSRALRFALTVTAILVGWAVAQYPYMLVPDVTIEEAARGRATLVAMLVALVSGAVILLPALVYLYVLFQRALAPDDDRTAGSAIRAGEV